MGGIEEETLLQWLKSVSGDALSELDEITDSDNDTMISLVAEITNQDVSKLTNTVNKTMVDFLEEWLADDQGKMFVIDRSSPMSLGIATLGAAVNCDHKDKFVGAMMGLDQHYQATLVGLIEEFNRVVEKPPVEQLRAIVKRLERENGSLKEEQHKKSDHLPKTVQAASDAQVKGLQEKIKDLERRVKDAQNHAEEVEAELDEKTREFNLGKRSLEEKLLGYEEEIRAQADELDVARGKAAQLVKAEAKLAKMMSKFEETSQLRLQLKEAQEEAQANVDKRLEMEAEINTVKTLRQQLETQKNRCVDLQSQVMEKDNEIKKRDEEIGQYKMKLSSAFDREKFLKEQIDQSKEAIAQLEAEAELVVSSPGGKLGSSPKALASDMESQSSKLERREFEQKIHVLETEKQQLEDRLASMENQLSETNASGASKDVVETLKKHLKEKEAECLQLVTDKEKLQNYVKQSLHTTQQKYKVALKNLQTQLDEKNQMIQSFKSIREEDEANHQREQRLIMSSFYDLGLELQRRTALANQSPGSWLAQSRRKI